MKVYTITPMQFVEGVYNKTMHYAKRTDRNQQDIMDALRDVGYSVVDLHEVGKGCPDILVGTRHANILVEIKMPGCKLNEREKEFFAKWNGPACVVSTPEEAVATIDRMTHYITQ